MNNPANPVHVVQPEQQLFGYSPDDWQRNASVVILFDHREQVFAKDLEGHDKVLAVVGVVEKLIEHLQVMSVVSCGFQLVVFVVLAQKLLPCLVFEFRGDIV